MSAYLFELALALYLSGALIALLFQRFPLAALRIGAISAFLGGALGTYASVESLIGGPLTSGQLPWRFLGETLSYGIDPLSAVFLLPIFSLSALFAVYSVEYLKVDFQSKNLGLQAFFYNLLVVSLTVVVTARNGALLLVGWEMMSLTSFFLVSYEHEKVKVRQAAWVYAIATHLGGLLLLAFFAYLASIAGSMDLNPVAARELAPRAVTTLFLLGLLGFGSKAGFWPLHVWLPKAHPAAPSHVSALMSGVMVKTGIYGIFRMVWLFGPQHHWWGLILIFLGMLSAVAGALFALGQRDVKALLAYCTVENVGVVALGLGLGVLGSNAGLPVVAALGYGGALLHVWNHALYKGLLFLGSGAVVHATGERDMERLGGLLKRMPATGWLFLCGSAAISGLPPFNGLISEWLIIFGLFQSSMVIKGWLGMLPLAGLAAMALMGALALAGFVKAFGISFLGEPRSAAPLKAHDPGLLMLLPMAALALVSLFIGLLPTFTFSLMARPVAMLDRQAANALALQLPLGQPLSMIGFLSAGLLVLILMLLIVRRYLLKGRTVETAPTWDCGFAAPTARMQYTGSSFSVPMNAIFGNLVRLKLSVDMEKGFFPRTGELKAGLSDTASAVMWGPVFVAVTRTLGRLRFLQAGRLQHYLLAIFLTLIGLLAWALAAGGQP